MSYLHYLLAKIGSILQNIIQLCIFTKQKLSYTLMNENTVLSFFK